MAETEIKCDKKINLLVYHKPLGAKCESKQNSVYSTTNLIVKAVPKKIHICTGCDMKRMCPPKICQCPSQVRRQPIRALLGLGLKSAVAFALVYNTLQAGIWGTAEDTQKLYTSTCKLVKPRLGQPKEIIKNYSRACESQMELFPYRRNTDPYDGCNDPFYSKQGEQEMFRKYWNCAIFCIFSFLAKIPTAFMKLSRKLENRIVEGPKESQEVEKTCSINK